MKPKERRWEDGEVACRGLVVALLSSVALFIAGCAASEGTTAPPTDESVSASPHAPGYTTTHGEEAASTTCTECHGSDGCSGCHQSRPPSDHGWGRWRLSEHGVSAAMEPERCATCHTTDRCVDCHRRTRR